MCIRDRKILVSQGARGGIGLKGRVWSKIMFCVLLAFAVKIVVARTAELNLAWFTRYKPRKPHSNDVITVSSLSACYAITSALAPRKFLEQPNFATREQNRMILFSVCC